MLYLGMGARRPFLACASRYGEFCLKADLSANPDAGCVDGDGVMIGDMLEVKKRWDCKSTGTYNLLGPCLASYWSRLMVEAVHLQYQVCSIYALIPMLQPRPNRLSSGRSGFQRQLAIHVLRDRCHQLPPDRQSPHPWLLLPTASIQANNKPPIRPPRACAKLHVFYINANQCSAKQIACQPFHSNLQTPVHLPYKAPSSGSPTRAHSLEP